MSWDQEAACRGADPDLFFLEGGGREAHARIDAVTDAFCCRCRVRCECLLAGLTEPYGIWGGMTTPDRARWAVANGYPPPPRYNSKRYRPEGAV